MNSLRHATPDGKEDVCPKRLVGGLNRQHMVIRHNRVVEIPFLNRLQFQAQLCLANDLLVLGPDWRWTVLGIRIILWNTHRVDGLQRNCRNQCPQHLAAGHHSRREIQRHQLGFRPNFGRGRIVAVANQNFRMMARLAKDSIDLRMNQWECKSTAKVYRPPKRLPSNDSTALAQARIKLEVSACFPYSWATLLDLYDIMKRIAQYLGLTALMFALTGCSPSSEKPVADSSSNANSNTSAPSKTVEVSNETGITNSQAVDVPVLTPLTVTENPQGQSVVAGTLVVLDVAANGSRRSVINGIKMEPRWTVRPSLRCR